MNAILRLLSSPIRLLPERLPRVFLYGAFVVAFLVVTFFDSRYSQVTYPVSWRTPFLNFLTYLLDPLLLHFLSLIFCGYLIWRYLALTHPEESAFVRLVVSFGFPFMLLVASFALEQLVLKPAFRYPRPGQEAQPLGEPWLTSWLRLRISSQSEDGLQDVPSGFALRQLILFNLTVWIAGQRPSGTTWLSGKQSGIVHVINTVALAFVIFSRVYRANHTLFAMTVAIGVATLLFWSFLAVIYSLSSEYRGRYRSLLAETSAAYLAFAMIFFAYSNDVGRWLTVSVVLLIALATAYLIPKPTIKSHKDG